MSVYKEGASDSQVAFCSSKFWRDKIKKNQPNQSKNTIPIKITYPIKTTTKNHSGGGRDILDVITNNFLQ